jgi:hypothetical protein
MARVRTTSILELVFNGRRRRFLSLLVLPMFHQLYHVQYRMMAHGGGHLCNPRPKNMKEYTSAASRSHLEEV